MAPSKETRKTTKPIPTHANACTHCRERKIRCGRERPRCANCERDGVGCDYSTPEKRVNHIKLLCDNVGGLEDRLNNIEAEVSSMNTLLQTIGSQKLSVKTTAEGEDHGGLSAYNTLMDDSTCLPPTDSHVVRDWSNLTDHYRGPCTLFALCNEFHNTLSSVQLMPNSDSAKHKSQQGNKDNGLAMINAAKILLDQACFEVGLEESDLQTDLTPIRLPPKQLLLMAQTQFFQYADYATDLFVQSTFWSNIESVYSRSYAPSDEAWAICFNTIILLALGPESPTQNSDSRISPELVRPCFLTIRSALSNRRGLMIAKLVNIQALALLSIAAQIYYPLGLSETIFAQACVLARTMGLHQVRAAPEGADLGEAQERFKVFRSLYLRDKSSSILRGSICWLPGFDCSLVSELSESSRIDPRSAIRIQLARLEDEVYRLLHSPRRSSARYQSKLLHLEQGLEHWANANRVFSSPCSGTREVDLQLEFLAARICILRQSPEPGHLHRALSDARASCLLVVTSYDKHETTMIDQLEALLPSKSPSKTYDKGTPGRSNDYALPRFLNLLDTFSVPAFFLLATNVVCPSSAYDESRVEEDLKLLEKTCTCFKELDMRTQANNHTLKVRRAFESLLEVVKIIKTTQKICYTNGHNSRMSISFVEQHRLSNFSNLPTPSTALMPPTSWETFTSKNTSATRLDSLSSGASPGLGTQFGLYYQSCDTIQPRLFPHHMQQSVMGPPNPTRPHISGSDESIDNDTDSMEIFNFLTKNPSASFDVTL